MWYLSLETFKIKLAKAVGNTQNKPVYRLDGLNRSFFIAVN